MSDTLDKYKSTRDKSTISDRNIYDEFYGSIANNYNRKLPDNKPKRKQPFDSMQRTVFNKNKIN